MTSVLLFMAMREIWGWSPLGAGAVAAVFIIVDGGFLAANLMKVLEGGYVPLALASLVYAVMWIWHRGVVAIHQAVEAEHIPIADFVSQLKANHIARVPGSAIFLTRARNQTPPVMAWHVRQNRSLHEAVLALTIVIESKPRVPQGRRLTLSQAAENFWLAEAHFGFIETPDIQAILASCRMKGAGIDLDDVTFYIGHETIVPREDGKGLPKWQTMLFAAMGRNAWRISDSLRLPHDHVVEIGREIEI
jgi:KUP system potassium uptake protein